MHARFFDHWARTFTRRRVPGLLAGLLAAPMVLAGAAASAKPRAAKEKRCKRPKQPCGTRCVNLKRDRRNCGGCGRSCPGGLRCRTGNCAPQFLFQWYASEPGRFLREPYKVAFAANGDLWVADASDRRVLRFAANGTYRSTLAVAPAHALVYPVGLASAPDDNLWVTDDVTHQVKRFSAAGQLTGILGDGASGEDGSFSRPFGVAVAPPGSPQAGRVYIADSDNHRIQSYANSLALTSYRKWGGLGAAPGELHSPNAIVVARNGDVYVSDTGNHRVQVFSPSGDFRREWGRKGTGHGRFHFPRGLALGADGSVYVVDSSNERIQVFSPSGRFLGTWGKSGAEPGRFGTPDGVAVAADGRIYVTDAGYGRVQVFG